MFGFLLKMIILFGLAGGIFGIAYLRKGAFPDVTQIPATLKQSLSEVDAKVLWSNVLASLDALVTNPNSDSPVVLGVKITSDSLSTVVDVIQSLPPDQANEIRSRLCPPTASSSAR